MTASEVLAGEFFMGVDRLLLCSRGDVSVAVVIFSPPTAPRRSITNLASLRVLTTSGISLVLGVTATARTVHVLAM